MKFREIIDYLCSLPNIRYYNKDGCRTIFYNDNLFDNGFAVFMDTDAENNLTFYTDLIGVYGSRLYNTDLVINYSLYSFGGDYYTTKEELLKVYNNLVSNVKNKKLSIKKKRIEMDFI